MCKKCVQLVGTHGQKSADKHAQVIPLPTQNDSFAGDTMENSHFYAPGRTVFTAIFPQAKTANPPKLFSHLSHLSPTPTITTTTYI